MKAALIALLMLVVCASGFAQTKVGAKLPDRVAGVLGVKSGAALGSREYDAALLQHLRSLGGLKEVFGYVCARAEADDLIVRAEWCARSLHVWFGAYEDGDRVECDVDVCFFAGEKASQVMTWVGREAAAPQHESVRAFVSRIDPPPASEEKRPNQPPQRNAGSRPPAGGSAAPETPSSPGPRG
ncbi:hypothetical protein [Opitutus terrae]|uniref:Uncharacterized protein n=1 Tax=Opitutus terrae (strain DSM 11246 / JCM 15787 / PB90-1) TaxID=452637 RepID=B1ZZ11_OPITP|nr:hypothetical protein [Opitutus terrae]ACB76334.1 hypothetical protein Oter_3054 [Opitutus terrae PB90-1]